MIKDRVLRPGPKSGFPSGFTAITRRGEDDFGTEIDFGVYRPAKGDVLQEENARETAWVLLRGRAEVEFAGQLATVHRSSLFDEPPTALHVGTGTPVTLHSLSADSEWAVVRAENPAPLEPRLFRPDDLTPEYRGAGLVQDACLRNVRLIFDRDNRPGSNLVVGEVVNYPGRWSSYPPHHHDQPEIYHYRFTRPAGYGHAEFGDNVLKIRDGDTVLIPPGLDHAQVSAPGYGMYYLWMIRHLPGNPYTGFTFAAEHQWTLDAAQQGWVPPALPTPPLKSP